MSLKQGIEKHISMLVEARAIASIEYENIINEIVDNLYASAIKLKKYDYSEIPLINKNGVMCKYERFSCNANPNIIKQIPNINELPIKLIINAYWVDKENYKKLRDDYYGGYEHNEKDNVINNQLVSDNHIIKIYITAINGNINKNRIKQLLTHEMNHVFENYYRLYGSQNTYGITLSQNKRENVQTMGDYEGFEMETMWCRHLFYRLFNESELSADATNVYTYLEKIKSKRRNYGKDIKGSDAYKDYILLKEWVGNLKYVNDSGFWNYIKLHTNYRFLQTGDFKNRFINKAFQLLEKYLRKIGVVASLYYDKNEGNKLKGMMF